VERQSYWSRTLEHRLSRRRAIAATGAAALGAAFLAACGGDGGRDEEEVVGLVTQPADTRKEAKRGGTLRFSVTADIPNLDPHFLSLANAAQVLLNYNRLTRVKPGILEQSDGTIIGDAVESWEFSPDKTTVTMKVRQNLGTPPVPPVNGRVLDSSDIVYSWERFKKNGNNRSDLANDINANAPVVSLTAPDAKTITVKMNSPVSTIMSLFSSQASGQFFIFPKEAEDKVDLRRSPIGAGVYYMGEYVTSARFVYQRNPNYYDKEVAFADTIEVPIVAETSTGLSQLKAGALHSYAVPADSIIQVKTDVPDISLFQTDLVSVGSVVFFGFKASPPERTPFRDVRVRQAYSMSLDRNLFVDTFGNVSKFTSQGVPVETAWNAAVPSTAFAGWWLDPKGNDFGENARFFKHDVAEAKKLLAAAGHPNGLEVISNQIGTPDYGPTHLQHIEVLDGFAAEAGFSFKKVIQDYRTNWPAEFRDSGGFFEGIAYRLQPGASDPGDQLYAEYNKGGSQYYGFDPDGKGLASREASTFIGDPTANDLTDKMKLEFDTDKRKQYALELQKHLGKMQYKQPTLGAASGFQVAWPAVRNWRVLRSMDFGQTWASYWLDTTLPPHKA
jgi:ABC-type transport system substrate-binding protein